MLFLGYCLAEGDVAVHMRDATFHKKGNVVGLMTSGYPGDITASLQRCLAKCLASGSTTFAVRYVLAREYRCVLSIDPAALPTGNWTTYEIPQPIASPGNMEI